MFSHLNIPSVGPSSFGYNSSQGSVQGAHQQPVAPKPSPTDFMQLLKGTQPQQDEAEEGADQALKLFDNLLNPPVGEKDATPVAPWAKTLEGFQVSVTDPDFIADSSKLGAYFANELSQIDFASGLSGADPNTFMRDTLGTMLTRAVQSSYVASKHITSNSILHALQDYSQRSYRNAQMNAAKTSESVPQGMGFIAATLAEKFTTARPDASPEQVRQAVELLMSNMKKAFQPSSRKTEPSATDWFSFMQ